MLNTIPDRELIARLEELRRDERASCIDVLHHLNEVERRSLHLRLGYSSLFAYCTGHLRYSESAAARRVQAARCLHRFPSVIPPLQSGEINLMTLGLVANLLTEANLDAWLDRIRGKTQREVEAIAATVRPPLTLRDRARLVQVAVPTAAPLPLAPPPPASTEPRETSEPDSSAQPTQGALPSLAALASPAIHSQASDARPPAVALTQPKVYIQFLVEQSFMTKYRTATALLSNRLTKLTFESVFTALIDDFLHRHQPAERHSRRERAAARETPTTLRDAMPLRTRDAVFARDRSRCTYVGFDGKRCEETVRLHVDHIKPVARGGSNEMTNLRLLCARHNQLEAQKIFGRVPRPTQTTGS